MFRRARTRDLFQNLAELARSLAAGNAFAAALVLNEFHEIFGDVDHAGVLVHGDKSAGAHHRSELAQSFVINRQIRMGSGNAAAGRTADLNRLEPFPVLHPPADLLDDGTQGYAHCDFHDSGADHFSGESEHLCSPAPFRPDRNKPVASVQNQSRNIGDCFNVVDDRRLPEKPFLRRERRARSRHPALALDAPDQRGFLAADERARAFADDDFQIETAVQNIFSEQTVRPRLLDCVFQTPDGKRVFRTDVDDGASGSDGIGRDCKSLNQTVRIPLNERAVHERPGVALIRIADHIFLVAGGIQGELPLGPRREAAASAPAQSAQFHLFADFRRRHGVKRLRERAVPAACQIFFNRSGIDNAAVLKHAESLSAEKRMLLQQRNSRRGGLSLKHDLSEQSLLRHSFFKQERGKKRFHLLFCHKRIDQPREAGKLDHHDRFRRTESQTAGFYDFRIDVVPFQKFAYSGKRVSGSRPQPASRRPDEHGRTLRISAEQKRTELLRPSGNLLLDAVVSQHGEKNRLDVLRICGHASLPSRSRIAETMSRILSSFTQA